MFKKTRRFLGHVLMILLIFVMSQSTISAKSLNEAPMLAKLVASGALPPLKERLRDNPAVVNPLEKIGT